MARRVVIMGAAGRDFHNFNVVFRDDPRHRGRRVHRDPDPRHRGTTLSAAAGGAALPGRDPDRARVRARGAHRRRSDRRGRLRLQRRQPRDGDARGVAGPRRAAPTSRCSGRGARCSVASTGGRDLRGAHRIGQEPDHPTRRRAAGASAGLRVAVVRHPMPYGDLVAPARAALRQTMADLTAHDARSRSARSTSRTSLPAASSTPGRLRRHPRPSPRPRPT